MEDESSSRLEQIQRELAELANLHDGDADDVQDLLNVVQRIRALSDYDQTNVPDVWREVLDRINRNNAPDPGSTA